MPITEYTDIAAVAYPASTGKDEGHKDVATNVSAVTAAINAGATALTKLTAGLGDDRVVLPVFVAPQWTWRKDEGSYGMADVEEIFEALIAASKKHRDVLIVPGTILWSSAPPGAASKVLPFPAPDATYVIDTAPVFFEGKLVHVLHKRFYVEDAEIDFSKTTPTDFWKTFKGKRDEVDGAGDALSPAESHIFGDKLILRKTFGKTKSPGIQFGIEVGTDIGAKVLEKTGRKVDVQIMLSSGAAGEAFSPGAMATGALGSSVALHCDGTPRGALWAFTVLSIEKKATVEEREAKTAGAVLALDDPLLPLCVRRLRIDPSVRAPKKSAEDYLLFRQSVNETVMADLVKLQAENELKRKEWGKERVKETERRRGEYPLKGRRKGDDGNWIEFESPMGIGLGFLVGVTEALDSMFEGLGDLDNELYHLGQFLQDSIQQDGFRWLQGPIKLIGKALVKTTGQLEGNAAKNKDFIRGTLVANADTLSQQVADLEKAIVKIREVCVPKYGIIIQTKKGDEEVVADDNPCGYSGFNVKIMFHGHKVCAEIQANTRALLFGKHSKLQLVQDGVFETNAQYDEFEETVGLRGALGHLFYDMRGKWEEAKDPDGEKAGLISREYYQALREGRVAKANADLSGRLDRFADTLTTPAWKKKYAEYYDPKLSASKRW